MTEDDTEQQSITDYHSQEQSSSNPDLEESENPPSPTEPYIFVQWLHDRDPDSATQATKHLPTLIKQVRAGGYKSPPAGECINYLLKSGAVEQCLDSPELIALLGEDHVDALPLIQYILETYPRNTASIEHTADLTSTEIDELPLDERVDGYRALSRLPPNIHIYDKLHDAAVVFDDITKVGGKYPVNGFFQTYAMRCLISGLQHPDEVSKDCVRQAIKDHPWSSLRIITINLKQATEAGILDYLIDSLTGLSIPDNFHHGRIIASLCEKYVQGEDQFPQSQVGELIKTALIAGVYPSYWETFVPELIKYAEQGDSGKSDGEILSAIVESIENDSIDASLTDELVEKLIDGSPDVWADSIRVLAESHPEEISNHTESLVTVARTSDRYVRTVLCEALSIIAAKEPQAVLSQLDPFIEDLTRVSSVTKFDDEILSVIMESIENGSIDASLIDEIVEKLLDASPDVWADSIRVLAESHPEEISNHTESLVTVARTSDRYVRTVLCEALSIIAAKEPQAVLPKLEPLIEDLARVSSVTELKDIGEILESAAVYPPPTQLTELYGSTDEAIDRKAKQIVANLRRQFRNKTPGLVPGDPESIQALSDDYSLVQRAGPITWESPSLSATKLSVINAVRQTAYATANDRDSIRGALNGLVENHSSEIDSADKSVQFISPSSDSEWIELAVLGVVFAQIVDPDIEATLHTPAKGGWGTKKDIKYALQQYGVAPSEDHTNVIPLLDLVPTARITNGEITIEMQGTTVVDDPPYLTLTRDINSLTNSSADIILYNYLPGIDATNAAQVQQWRTISNTAQMDEDNEWSVPTTVESDAVTEHSTLSKLVHLEDTDSIEVAQQHPEDPVHIELYSIFTAQYAADRRQHIGPPTDLPYPVVFNEIVGGDENVGEASESQTWALTSGPSSIDLHRVQSENDIGEMLAKVDRYADQVTDPEIAAALQHFRYTIGSLPVPVELHDTWVQNQIDQGNKWVPRQLRSRQQGIETLVDEAGFDAQILDEAVITIDTLLDRLNEANPLFDELLTVLDKAVTSGNRVGVLCNKKTYKDMLDTYLRSRASNVALGDDVLLLDEDTVRELDAGKVDWLVTFGPLPPQTAIFYHHPTVEKTIVLAHADGTTESRVYGVEHKRRPFLPKCVDQELPELAVTTRGSTPDISEASESFTDDLYRTFLSVASQSRSDDGQQSASSGQLTRYRVGFEEIEEMVLQDTHPHLVRSEDHLVSTGEYVLRSLSRISRGDEMVIMESGTQSDLWEEFLREDWENDDAADTEETFIDAVELWYDAVSGGLQAHADTSDLSDGIGDFAREIEPEVTVNADAIRDWARSVYQAESPSDLVFRSDLRIGPRNTEGVKAVAEAYGNERMTDNWDQVFTRIKTIRTTHRKRGSVFWQRLADRACDGDVFNRPGVSRATVTRCQEIE